MDKASSEGGTLIPGDIAKVLIDSAKSGETIYGSPVPVVLSPAKSVEQICKERGITLIQND